MTIRARILLVAGVAVTLVCLMALLLYSGARRGQRLRQQLVSIQKQIDSLERLHSFAWPFLNQLAQARQIREDTGPVLREMTAAVEVASARLMEGQTLELKGRVLAGVDWSEVVAEQQEQQAQQEIRQMLLDWAALAERRVRELPSSVPLEPQVEWLLYSEFEQTVGQRIVEAQDKERAEAASLEALLDDHVWQARWVAVFVPTFGLLLMGLVTAAILAPLRRSLLELTDVARRIGQGDFDIDVIPSSVPPDDLGMLSHAIGRMARELRESLEEKQRMIRAEAESSEREALRYQALLEDTVRARTAELAEANTRLRESLQELQSTQEQLLSADRLASVGRLAAGVGHEINNPLAFILSNLRYAHQELNELSGAPSEELRQELISALAEASEGAERVRLIVQDLKTLARPDDVALGPVNVAAVVRSAVKMARHETRDRALLVEECEGVPPVHANAARLGQVFLNLLINAAHAIEPGRVRENEIRVVARVSVPGQVTVEVRDTGAGIPPEHLRRIFDPFFTTKPVGVGTGLGLSVCHRIITSLGGDIRVESEPGRGTCFFVSLPVSADSQESASPPAA
ncbi:sensor histidine kinase [Cystobacter ferrugineus]|uniref:histidine kinase n=1 Tax=Cystobacter ferrugineus TaxID=83449 RepID=A0A1L9AXY9_9BACT|nr:ATP-binding protein [Cystobacter ferrugineus]OJH34793.1 hypothetical protein BON30_42335 [Cystobacter ferrugineus]